MTKKTKIQYAHRTLPVNYVVFDILYVNGRDLRQLPLIERKQLLNQVLDNNEFFSKSLVVPDRGIALFNQIKDHQMEGVVAKRKDSTYVSRRSEKWQKIINYQYAEVYITGYHKNEFGWIAAVPAENGRMRPAGIIELAVPTTHKKAFYGVTKSIVTGEDRHFIYVEPRIKAKVKFRNWTGNGMLRSPAFVDFIV